MAKIKHCLIFQNKKEKTPIEFFLFIKVNKQIIKFTNQLHEIHPDNFLTLEPTYQSLLWYYKNKD